MPPRRRNRFFLLMTASFGLLLTGCETTSQPTTSRPGEALTPGELPHTRTIERTKDLTDLPQAIHMVKPVYPFPERAKHISGVVIIQFVVDTGGNVAQARAIQAPSEALGQSAVDAIMQSKFTPGSKHGHRVNCLMRVPITFSLDDK